MGRCLGLIATSVLFLSPVLRSETVRDKGAADAPPKRAAASYVHAVTIPLNEDAPKGTAEMMVGDCHKMLGKIPAVRSVKAGRPAEQHSPQFVKKDYSVGLVILVDDHAGLIAYLDHPLHVQFVAKYKKHIDFERLRVFDFVDGR